MRASRDEAGLLTGSEVDTEEGAPLRGLLVLELGKEQAREPDVVCEDDDLVVGAKSVEALDDMLDALVVKTVDGVVEENRRRGWANRGFGQEVA